MNAARLAVLASGKGSNLEAIARYLDAEGDSCTVQLCLVASDRVAAPALSIARDRGIAAVHLHDPSDGEQLQAVLKEHRIDLVALAGYLKMVPPQVVQGYAGKILNVHPALLPKFGGAGMYGLRVHQAVLDAGATVTGVTVHLVSDEYDRGDILAQWPVKVIPGDTAQALAARVLQVEHALYPKIICAVADGTVSAAHPLRPQNSELSGLDIPWTRLAVQ